MKHDSLTRGVAIAGLIWLQLSVFHGARAAEKDQPPRTLFVMKPDGSALRSVVFVEAFKWLSSPRWSHDGNRLAFAASGGQPDRCLIVDITGKNLIDLGAGSRPDWSPDDKQILFEVPHAGRASLWVQNADGQASSWLANGHAARWSPDGSQIAAVGPLRILDTVDGSERLVLGADKQPDITLGCEWSPDGKQLAAVVDRGGAHELLIVSALSAKKSFMVRLAADLDGCLSWSPDGKHLAVSIHDKKLDVRRMHLLDVDGAEAPRPIPGQEGDNCEPAWSPDGTQLAFASSRKTAEAPAAAAQPIGATLERIRSYDAGGTVYSVALAPDGQTALLGANMNNQRVQLWDVASGEVKQSYAMIGIFVAIAPSGRQAACSEHLKSLVTYFNLENGEPIRQFRHTAMVMFVEFSGDGSRLLSGARDKTATVFDVNTGNVLARFKHAEPLTNGAFSPDGRTVATASDDNKLHLWDVASAKQIREIQHPALVRGIAFSPDGRQIMTGTGGAVLDDPTTQRVAVSQDNSLRLWDVATGNPIREMKGHEHAISSIAFSPDGRRVVSGSFDKTLRLWDVESGQELSRVDGQSWIFKVVYSSYGDIVLASGGNARTPDTRLQDFPDERVRVFRIVPQGKPSSPNTPGQ
jgi:WD40 repeat protein